MERDGPPAPPPPGTRRRLQFARVIAGLPISIPSEIGHPRLFRHFISLPVTPAPPIVRSPIFSLVETSRVKFLLFVIISIITIVKFGKENLIIWKRKFNYSQGKGTRRSERKKEKDTCIWWRVHRTKRMNGDGMGEQRRYWRDLIGCEKGRVIGKSSSVTGFNPWRTLPRPGSTITTRGFLTLSQCAA